MTVRKETAVKTVTSERLYQLCCEGAKCNNGLDAEARENVSLAGILNPSEDLRRTKWSNVTGQLKVTSHRMVGNQAQCVDCGNVRKYGN